MVKARTIHAEPWFIKTKLSPPVANARIIERVNVVSLLDSIDSYHSGFVIAPAGFGKSSLLSQWREALQKKGLKVAWLSLDYNDSDLRQFASYLIIALSKTGIELGSLEFAAYKCLEEFSIDQVTAHLLSKLSDIDEKIVLILDDYYRAESDEVNAFMSQLLDHVPINFSIIVSSRSQPNLNVASRVMGCTAFEVDQSMLSFSLSELKRFIGPHASDQFAETLLSQTEGWAVAVQLATVANKGNIDSKTLFKGKQQYITNYFTEQILDQSTAEERNFLMYTSILEQFNIELAGAVTGIDDVQSLIDSSPHIRSLLITLDQQHSWFRYHHLFTELLLAKLKQKQPDIINTLHSSASLWFEQNNQVADAVSHARQSNDLDRAANLFLAAGGWELVLYGGVGLMRNLLRNFTSDDFDRHPRVRLANVYSLLKDGYITEAEAQFHKIKIQSSSLCDEKLVRDMYLVERLLKSYCDGFIDRDSFHSMKKNLELWKADDLLGIAILQSSIVLSAIAQGLFKEAKTAAERGLAAMLQAESIIGANYLVIHLGQIALYQADFELAKIHLTESIDMANKNFGIDSRLKTNSDINLHAMEFWQSPHLLKPEKMQELIQNACNTDGWFEIYAAGFTALFEYYRLFNMPESSALLLQLSINTSRKRELTRLIELTDTYRLMSAITQGSPKHILLAMNELDEHKSDNSKLDESANWSPYCERIYALGLARLNGYESPNLMQGLDKSVDITKEIGATLHLIRLLVLRATLHTQAQNTRLAFEDLLLAVGYAIRSDIQTPFFINPDTIELCKECIQDKKISESNKLEVDFLTGCIDAYKRLFLYELSDPAEQPLSKREMEVLNKLSLGLANKEIARELNMTNHTVKFHLKNIFIKLEVDKRINAVNKARDMGLIH